MTMSGFSASTLVLGLGNVLLTDDGFGVHVIQTLQEADDLGGDVSIRDGGTIAYRFSRKLKTPVR